jgi:hypothetical protein
MEREWQWIEDPCWHVVGLADVAAGVANGQESGAASKSTSVLNKLH